ncbi:sensor domain-containing diguanylate cyclase [Thalassomonas actiniarum]|uniref:diguanylate cyclase n=1 Tax=Thalassomonas actiniarum TaxID=485447 RepID=A0AAE9YQF4_9GAMM|nr:tetratricopeptide repeat-containing diguanylate cyclase [Thalassomonas actiniarum]WDD98563.1 GGDEF domain-containing protein [Thalassomonas actiniarum]
MQLTLKYIITGIFLFLFSAIAVPVALAQDRDDISSLQGMFEEVNREPWLSYRRLQALEQEAGQWPDNEKLWLLLRKAQAELLLYLNADLEVTVKQAQQLITAQTPAEISGGFNVYAGVLAQQKGLYSQAVDFFQQALTLAEQANLNHIYIVGKQELAYTRSLTELYQTSLKELQETYVEAFALGDKFLLARVNETYGAIYGYLGEYEKSVEYYQKALASYEQLSYRAHIADAVYALATIYRYWQKYQLAITTFERYRTLIDYTPNREVAFFAVYGLGMTLAEQGQCARGIAIIDEALLINALADYKAELLKRKGACLMDKGDFAGAQQALSAAGAIFAEIPELKGTKWQLEVEKLNAELAYARGENGRAYQVLERYLEQYAELQRKNADSRLEKVRLNMEQSHKEREVSLGQKQQELTELRKEHYELEDRQQKYFLLFAVSLSIFFLVVMLYQRKYNDKILELSTLDPLSKAYNRRYVFNYLKKYTEGTVPEKGELSVILLDIDNFKHINDNFGHLAGDQVICRVAQAGQKVLRQGDVMGRISGEEFLCVLPRISPEQCRQVAQRLAASINDYIFEVENKKRFSVSVSIGIASLSPQCSDSVSLYEQADLALYRAKEQGAHSAVVYQPEMA